MRKRSFPTFAKIPVPKPCPTCYTPMIMVDGKLVCPKGHKK